jgi:hypothetical protein
MQVETPDNRECGWNTVGLMEWLCSLVPSKSGYIAMEDNRSPICKKVWWSDESDTRRIFALWSLLSLCQVFYMTRFTFELGSRPRVDRIWVVLELDTCSLALLYNVVGTTYCSTQWLDISRLARAANGAVCWRTGGQCCSIKGREHVVMPRE